MRLSYIPQTHVREDHDELVSALVACNEGRGPKALIGIRNESGTVYMRLETFGTVQFLDVIERLDRLGFEDEFPTGEASSGCDIVMSRSGHSRTARKGPHSSEQSRHRSTGAGRQ
jgi:hypothetical protein